MPAYRVRFVVEFVADDGIEHDAIAEIMKEIRGTWEVASVTSVAYGDLEVTDPDAAFEDGEEDE